MKKILFILVIVSLLINTIGCTRGTSGKEPKKPDIRGLITKVVTNDSGEVFSILVEGKLESDTTYDKASVSIDKGTKITDEITGEKLTAGELKEGMKVEIVFDGPVAESYPVQAKAKTIMVIEDN